MSCIGCNGPISDWPHSKSDDGTPAETPQGGGGVVDAATGTGTTNGPGGGVAGGGTTAPPGGTAGGAIGGGLSGQIDAGAPPFGGATAGGEPASMDAGVVTASDAGLSSPDAGTLGDASASDASAGGDAALPDGSAIDADAGDATLLDGSAIDAEAGDAGPEAGYPDGDGGCLVAGDAGPSDAGRWCPAYGCTTSLSDLAAAADSEGACTADPALTLVCQGELSRAAARCTQQSTFSLSLARAVMGCLAGDPALSEVEPACRSCYVDEALCTLANCYVTCVSDSVDACVMCRRAQCGEALATCTGLPAP